LTLASPKGASRLSIQKVNLLMLNPPIQKILW